VSASGTSVIGLDGCDVVSLSQADGSEQWRSRVPKTVTDCSFWFSSQRGDVAPVVSDGVAYVSMGSVGVGAFDATTGAVIWRRNLNPNISTLTVTEQWVIVASSGEGGGISVVDKATGDIVRSISTSVVPVWSGITVAGDLMLFMTQTGRVAAVDLPTMELAWSSSVVAPAAIFSRPSLAGGKIFMYANDFNPATCSVVGLGP